MTGTILPQEERQELVGMFLLLGISHVILHYFS